MPGHSDTPAWPRPCRHALGCQALPRRPTVPTGTPRLEFHDLCIARSVTRQLSAIPARDDHGSAHEGDGRCRWRRSPGGGAHARVSGARAGRWPPICFASDELGCLLEEPQRPVGHRVRDPVHLSSGCDEPGGRPGWQPSPHGRPERPPSWRPTALVKGPGCGPRAAGAATHSAT